MTTTIQTLQQQLKTLEDAHAAALQTGNIGLAGDIDRKIQPLADLLAAPARKASAQRDLQALRDQATQAQVGVDRAQGVVNELQGRHAEVVAQLTADRELTAQAILQATKEGRTIKAETPDRTQALALESALSLAENEHQAAVAVLASVQAKVAQATHELGHAERDCASLQFELELRTFAKALRAYTSAVPDYSLDNAVNDIQQRFYVEA